MPTILGNAVAIGGVPLSEAGGGGPSPTSAPDVQTSGPGGAGAVTSVQVDAAS